MPGQRNAALYETVSRLLREADTVRRDHAQDWDDAQEFYLGNQHTKAPPKNLVNTTVNRIQNVVIATAAIQTEQRPRVKLQPVETNEKPIVFLSEMGAQKLATTPEAQFIDPNMAAGLVPLDDATLANLAGMSDVPTPDPATGAMVEAPLFGEDDFHFIDDATVTDFLQTVHDVQWSRSDADYTWIENVLNKGIIGHQGTIFQWDTQSNRPVRINVHPKNIWLAPESTSVEDADYVIFVERVPLGRAIKRYPEYEAQLRELATRGSRSGIHESVITSDRDVYMSERNVVDIVSYWQRNHQYPVEDAGFPEVAPGVYETPDGELTAPGRAGWPTRAGIRQVQMIHDLVLFDGECPFVDIPISWNKNLPIPYQPYGQGDPKRLMDLQKAINRVNSCMHNMLRFLQSPQQVIPRSVANALGGKLHELYAHPGRVLVLEDYLFQQYNGKPLMFADAPSVPPTWVNYIQLLFQIFDDVSGWNSILQGRTTSAAESGKAILALQTAARGPLGFKALFTERAIKYDTRLAIQAMIDFMPEEAWLSMCSKYPRQVLGVLLDRMKRMDFDIAVEVVGGKGTNRAVEEENARLDLSLGLETVQGALERLNRPDAKRKAEEILQERMGMAPIATGAPQASGKGDTLSDTVRAAG